MALPRHNPRGALSLLLMLLLLAVSGCDAAETTAADDGASDEAAAIEHLSKIITWQSDVLAHHSNPFPGRIHTDYLTAYRQAMEVDGLDYVHERPLAIRAEIVPSGYDGLPFLRATFVGSDASRPVAADLATPRSDGEPEFLLQITLNADDEVVRRTLRRVSYSTIFLTYLEAGRATATDMREVAEEGFAVRYLDPKHIGENLYIRFRCIDGKQTRWAPVADRRGEASGPESGA